jgi:polyisoprenoid-binding protein YceI
MNDKTKWSIDKSHSEISFKIRHLMISNIKGSFKNYDASIYTTGTDFTNAEIDLWIDPASINTGDEKRDEHLRGADFFDVANHKQISFSSNTMQKKDAKNEFELWGDFTLKGITKHIKLDVYFAGIAKNAYGSEIAGFVLTGKLNRSDWGLVWNSAVETGTLLISEEVHITCEIELINLGSKGNILSLENETKSINS